MKIWFLKLFPRSLIFGVLTRSFPRSKPEERKLIVKWLSPIPVNAPDGEEPVVVHNVKE